MDINIDVGITTRSFNEFVSIQHLKKYRFIKQINKISIGNKIVHNYSYTSLSMA